MLLLHGQCPTFIGLIYRLISQIQWILYPAQQHPVLLVRKRIVFTFMYDIDGIGLAIGVCEYLLAIYWEIHRYIEIERDSVGSAIPIKCERVAVHPRTQHIAKLNCVQLICWHCPVRHILTAHSESIYSVNFKVNTI